MLERLPRFHKSYMFLPDHSLVIAEAMEDVKRNEWNVTIQTERAVTEEEDKWIRERIYEKLREQDLRDWPFLSKQMDSI